MEFIFQISTYNRCDLEEQLGWALDRRAELISRQRLPRIWKGIDWLNRRPKAQASVSHGRAIRYKIYCFILVVLGIILLVPGLMEPQKLIGPLIAGTISTIWGIVSLVLSRKHTKKQIQVASASMKPWRKNINKRYRSASAKLLEGLQSLELHDKSPLNVSFTENGMSIGGEEMIPYLHFNAVVETKDIFLMTWNERVIVLQKRDMTIGTHLDFIAFLEEMQVDVSVQE
jgi:hypothetical protein